MKRHNVLTQLVEVFLFRALLLVACCVRRYASKKWEKFLLSIEKNEGDESSFPSRRVYTPIIQRPSETVVHSRSPSDQASHVTQLLAIPDWAKEIPTFLSNQLSAHTRRAYENDLKQFFHFLNGRIDPQNLHSLKTEHVIVYRKFLEEGRLTGKVLQKSTVNRKLAVVKSFLQWLKTNRLISDNPAQLVKGFPQSQESSLKGLSDEEAFRILQLPSRNSRAGALHFAVLSVLFYLGLRKGELIDLKMGDIDQERGTRVIKVRGKGHKIRVLPITKNVEVALNHYFHICRRDIASKEAPLFLPTKNPKTGNLNKSLNPNAVTYMVVRYAKKAGVLKTISPHSCRATCISNALDRRATQRSVQHLAGWSTPLMIQRYDKRREDLKNSAAFLVDYQAIN